MNDNSGFLNEKDILDEIPLPENIELSLTSSYDEESLLEQIKSSQRIDLFIRIAIQLAIVGWGNGKYGDVFDKDGEKHSIEDVFKSHGYKLAAKPNDSLKPDEMTAQRLMRIFRFHIKRFIEKTGSRSYLFRKYCKNPECSGILIFPAAEHLVEEQKEAKELLETYEVLDAAKGTNFADRIKRIYQARGLVLVL